MDTVKILFVCMGNICRSPAAEGVFRKMVQDAGLQQRIEIDSCGTINYHEGSAADPRMSAAALKRGYSLDSTARQIRPSDLKTYDKILVADDSNMASVGNLDPGNNFAGKIGKITDYHDDDSIREVPDPYYGGDAGFENVMDILETCCGNLLEELKHDLNVH